METLGRLFQLTLYGLKISDLERAHLLELRPQEWRQVLPLIESKEAQALVRDFRWCREQWYKLDKWSEQFRIQWTYLGHENYPARLAQLSAPPLILSYVGIPVWLEWELIAVVGSREPLAASVDWMRQCLLPFLSKTRVSIASGGARGIDRAAHEMTMLADRPPVCFLPSGILQPYPDVHQSLFRGMVNSGGVMISGFAPDAKMQKGFFHARNRWIAGISSLTFVVEAQRKSGSYLTAKMAMEEGRPLCTLPVSPLSKRGMANLDLIFEGAQMLRDEHDLLTMFAGEMTSAFAASQRFQSEQEKDDIDGP